jgi:hypothetical protein
MGVPFSPRSVREGCEGTHPQPAIIYKIEGMNIRAKRILAVLALAATQALPIDSQHRPSSHQSKIFTAGDKTFQFSHPDNFQVCTEGKLEPCLQFRGPVCDQDAIVCVVNPTEQFKRTNLLTASFQVRQVRTEREGMTADVCVTPYPQKSGEIISEFPEFMISAQRPAATVGGVMFVHGLRERAGMSHFSSENLYRTFHRQQCFELSLNEFRVDPGVVDPPMETLARDQQKELDASLLRMLHSFRFLD